MLLRFAVLPFVAGCLLTGSLVAQVPLAELADVARARAERARPAQEKALEPFLANLELDYRSNYQFLDGQIREAAELGDGVVPLLLEKLEPAQNSEKARHLAGNCRRVLELLDPSSFVDALAELLNSRYETTRREAIRLLGRAETPQAERLLTDLVTTATGEDQRLVLRSLSQHGAPAAAQKAVGLLGSSDQSLRADVLDYLIAARAGDVAPTVIQALGVEKEDRLLPRYIEYFASSVTANDAAAGALLQLLGERLDYQDTKQLVQALATVAPRQHDGSVRRLYQLLDSEKTSALAVHTAITLRKLGESQGVKRLKRTLDEQLRKPQRKREAALFEQRGNLLLAIGEYADAGHDYEKIIEYSSGVSMTRRAYIGLIRCEANRRRWTQLTRTMKNSGMTAPEIKALAIGDEAMTAALEHSRVASFLEDLEKSQAPR